MHRNLLESLNSAKFISYERLNQKFESISLKINSLLMPEAPVKLLATSQEEEVFLKLGFKRHYKVVTKNKPVPLKIRILTANAMKHTFIYVSQVLQRPSKDHCESSFLIRSKKSLFTLYGDTSKSKMFADEAVYFTIECDKEAELMFVLGFRNELLTYDAKRKRLEGSAANEKEKVKAFSLTEEDFKKLSIASPSPKTISRHFRIKSRGNVVTKLKRLMNKKHREQVFKTRSENEEKEIARKFLLSNKNLINQWHDAIIERKKTEKKVFKKSTSLWVTHIHLQQIARLSYNNLHILKENKEKMAVKFYSAIKIRMALRKYMSSSSRKSNERFRQKIAM
eukprot:TRINITY_DN4094_c0_g1_i1.p1 TRINITY_DN4094_c0_g1~~TRINITY_DN4094_c0_g1_i1.p1  ORF type:complete len:338 (+),score=82.40 TRINITY_DN4094_c0_g1_i1:577-1590(+)